MRTLTVAIALCLVPALPARQTVVKPYRASPGASVTQELGLCSVRIDYHRPAVKGRRIWGGLVPYGQVWRAGANEATTIAFSDPVKVGGRDLAAGTYAFFAIPGPEEWTLVFSRNARQWGSYTYQPAQDALRLQAKPRAIPHQEYLAYTIQVEDPGTLRVELAWDALAVGFDVAVDAQGRYWAYLEQTLAGAGPGEWQPLDQGAAYCLASDTHLDRAMEWVDRSLRVKEGWRNLSLKAQLLRRAGRAQEGLPLLRRAIGLAEGGAAGNTVDELKALEAEWNQQP
jgi:hypothetical protein